MINFHFSFYCYSPEIVKIKLCIKSESRVKAMRTVFEEFKLVDTKEWSVSQCLGCEWCK